MNRKLLYRFIVLVIALAPLGPAHLTAAAHWLPDDNLCQPAPAHKFSPQEFKQQCDCFITEQAKLTPQEAQKFFPLYHAMKDAQRKLMHEKGSLEFEAIKGEYDEKKSLKTLEQINAIDRKIMDVELDYQKKMLKVIPAAKLLKVKIAEKRFERKVLKKMANRPNFHKK
ncbi:MAG: hypothetical protein J5678_04795 [Bacteroidaceae bacterium]|nr:hypothetical protein [Bacteroidaceae bacterium]